MGGVYHPVRDGDWSASVVGRRCGRPADPSDPPIIEPTSFEPAIATQLTALFQRALAPDTGARFSSADELAVAWQGVFAALDTEEDGAGGSDDLVDAATLDTPLERAGLSARALSAVSRLDVANVGQLLGVHPTRINSIRGLGETYRKEIQARIRGWRSRLSGVGEVAADQPMGTERLVSLLLGELKGAEQTVMERLLGLSGDVVAGEWPSTGDTAKSLGLTRDRVAHAVDQAVTTWGKKAGAAVDSVLAETATLLTRNGRVMVATSLANALVAQRGSLLEGEQRLRQGAALLRSAYEIDARMPEPILELRRGIGKRADVIALRETADPDESGQEFPPADILTETAIELGRRADELVATGVVPFATANAALCDIVSEAGAPTLIDLTGRRLLTLAASVSTKAAVSGFDELYPVDLDPQEAVERALRGKPGRRISESAVRRSVKARFPLVELPAASHRLGALVSVVLPGVVNHNGVYELASEARSATHTGIGLDRLRTGRGRGGCGEVGRVTCTSRRTHLDHAAQAIRQGCTRTSEAVRRGSDRCRIPGPNGHTRSRDGARCALGSRPQRRCRSEGQRRLVAACTSSPASCATTLGGKACQRQAVADPQPWFPRPLRHGRSSLNSA